MRARWCCAAAASALLPAPLLAQATAPPAPPQTEQAQLDPNAPLDPMPGLGIAWPELNPKETTAPSVAPAVPVRKGRTAVGATAGNMHYTIQVEGLGSVGDAESLLHVFRQQSALQAERKDAANAAQIGRRAAADADLLEQMLRAQGYYDASVEPSTQNVGGALSVILTVDPGSQYRFASVDLPGLDRAGPQAARLRDAFAVKAGDPVVASDVIAAGLALTTALGEQGYAEAKVGKQDIEVNHQTHFATLRLPIDPGPVARFGSIHVRGRPPFSAGHVALMARFKRGDPFQRSKIDDLRRALIATTLVANADIQVVPREGGRTADLDVRLEPAPSHTIAGELGYGTGQGVHVEASWTDRNFFNPEGALTLRGILGTTEQLFGAQLRRSNFMMRDQTLNVQVSASHQKFAAYRAKTIDLTAYIERQSNFIWQKPWTWSYGAESLRTTERGVYSSAGVKDTQHFAIAALPLALGYDGSDSLLDPTRGFRLSVRMSPEIAIHQGRSTYGRGQFDASAYHPLSDRVVLAGRVRVASIFGADLFDIAPSRRLYSGGGGSVRGYGYQQLGPKDVDGDPIGGRGLAEFALETRIRLKQFGGNFGVVPFFDGGTLTSAARPDFAHWRYAAGLGVRYYSTFGPIRIDVGVPLNRQKGDGPVAVTVSLGQAF